MERGGRASRRASAPQNRSEEALLGSRGRSRGPFLIWFLDASALVKRYVAEAGRKEVLSAIQTGPVAVCRISEAEIISALARRSREGSIDPRALERTVRAVRGDFLTLVVVEVTPAVIDRSVGLLLRYPLRAADSIQLAAALELRDRVGEEIRVLAFDERLREAARSERLVEHSR